MYKVLQDSVSEAELGSSSCESVVRCKIQAMYDAIAYLGDIGEYELSFNFTKWDKALELEMTLANPPEEHFTISVDCTLDELKDLWSAHVSLTNCTIKRYCLRRMGEHVTESEQEEDF